MSKGCCTSINPRIVPISDREQAAAKPVAVASPRGRRCLHHALSSRARMAGRRGENGEASAASGVSRIRLQAREIDAHARDGVAPFVFIRTAKDEVGIRRTDQPGILGEFLLKLPGAPARIA